MFYSRQIWSWLTHWKGAPARTTPFVAPDPPPSVRIAVAGDVGRVGRPLRAVARAMQIAAGDDPYDALLLLGDNVYPHGDPARLPATVFEPFGPLFAMGTQLLTILGNHDVERGHAAAHMQALGMESRWWKAELDGVLIVGLDSTRVDDDEQAAWLDATLAGASAPWKVVAVHSPPYSAGYQGSSLDVRARFAPTFARHGVHVVFSGHEHDYQRSRPIDGVTYVVSGGGSRRRRTGSRSFTAESFATYHFVDVAVYPDRMELRTVDYEMGVADRALIPNIAPDGNQRGG